MCWTHVWMRDGILPLNRERLQTTSTVKARVSQVGQAAFLLSSEKLPISPPHKCHPYCFPHIVRFNCLVLLDNPWHSPERSLSGCHVPLASRECQVPCLSSDDLGPQDLSSVQLCLLGAELRTLRGSRSTGGGQWHHCTQGHADGTAARGTVRRGQTCSGDAWPSPPAPDCHVCAGPCASQLWATLSGCWQPQMPSASNSVPWGTSRSPCPGCCASEHVCWWQPVLQSLGTGPAGHFGDKSIMGTPSTVGSLIFHNKPNILPPNPATLHHKLSAKDVVSGIISGGTGVRCGGKKAQVRRDIVACLAPASTALCCSCWSCSTLCSGLQKTNCREFMIFYYIWKEWHVRKILMCLCLDRQESRRTNYNINICSGRITNRNRAD